MILESVLAFYVLWILFLAVMSLKAAYDAGNLSKLVLILGIPLIVFAFVIDVVLNWTIFTLIFLEIGHEATLSQRVGRLRHSTDWRGPIAVFICQNLLDPFQSGGHCHG